MKADEYFQVADALKNCASQDAIRRVCADLAQCLELEHFIYGAFFPLSENIVILNGYPAEWREHYDERGYIDIDPTVKHCSSHTSALIWNEIKIAKGRRGQPEREVMEEARAYGLKHGFSLPIHAAGSEWGMLSFASRDEHQTIDSHLLLALQFIAQSTHEAVKRVALASQLDSVIVPAELTEREQECLKWTAHGKTAWEISKILNLSESTVGFHIKNAINKMEVTNRPHAVAKAMAQSRITLF